MLQMGKSNGMRHILGETLRCSSKYDACCTANLKFGRLSLIFVGIVLDDIKTGSITFVRHIFGETLKCFLNMMHVVLITSNLGEFCNLSEIHGAKSLNQKICYRAPYFGRDFKVLFWIWCIFLQNWDFWYKKWYFKHKN